jgi:hypothetical protein
MVSTVDIMQVFIRLLLIGKAEKYTRKNAAYQTVQRPQSVECTIPCRSFCHKIIERIKEDKKEQDDEEKVEVVYSL